MVEEHTKSITSVEVSEQEQDEVCMEEHEYRCDAWKSFLPVRWKTVPTGRKGVEEWRKTI